VFNSENVLPWGRCCGWSTNNEKSWFHDETMTISHWNTSLQKIANFVFPVHSHLDLILCNFQPIYSRWRRTRTNGTVYLADRHWRFISKSRDRTYLKRRNLRNEIFSEWDETFRKKRIQIIANYVELSTFLYDDIRDECLYEEKIFHHYCIVLSEKLHAETNTPTYWVVMFQCPMLSFPR
jgi:hypothetical protein